uniref:Ion transport domain-containing protein n=1 Tax=Aureoumbra lagunensis TaxID=44058 RepID=A0A7S3JWW3_9STRA
MNQVRTVGDEIPSSYEVTQQLCDVVEVQCGDGDPIHVDDDDDIKSATISPKRSLPQLAPIVMSLGNSSSRWKRTEAISSAASPIIKSPSSSLSPKASTICSMSKKMMGNSTVTMSEHQRAIKAAEFMNKKPGRCTIHPDSFVIKIIEIALFFALVYTAVITPAEIAFVMRKKYRIDGLFIANQIINIIFIIDLILNFCLHYENYRGEWIQDQWLIAKNYIRRLFLIDLISSIPFDVIGLFISSSVIHRVSALRLLRLLRLLKIIKVTSSMNVVRRYRSTVEQSFAVTNLLIYIVCTIFVAHWFACAWGFVGNLSDLENSWRSTFSDTVAWSINAPKNQYLVCLYFATYTLTTCGFGDVSPVNLAEYALVTIVMFVGAFMWAYIIGSVCGTVSTLDLLKIQYQQRYDQLNGMLLDINASPQVARKVRSYLFHTERVSRHVEYATLIDHLSPALQRDLCDELGHGNVAAVHYLKYRSTNFRLAIFKRLKTRLFCPLETIETKDLLLIKNSGVIKRIEPSGFPKLYVRGMALNLDFLLRNPEFRDQRPLQAGNYVEVNTLSRWALEEVCELYPKERSRILWMNVFYALGTLVRIMKKEEEQHKFFSKNRLLMNFKSTPDTSNNTHEIDDLEAAVAICRAGDLQKCSAALRDTRRLAELSITANPETFAQASKRLRSDPDFILWSVAHCTDRDWKRIILPHIEPTELQNLLTALCVDGTELERRKYRKAEKRIAVAHDREVTFEHNQAKLDLEMSARHGNARLSHQRTTLRRGNSNHRANFGSLHRADGRVHDGHNEGEEHKVHHRTLLDADAAPDDEDAVLDYDEAVSTMPGGSLSHQYRNVDDVTLNLFD